MRQRKKLPRETMFMLPPWKCSGPGWGFEQPGLAQRVPALGRGVELDRL